MERANGQPQFTLEALTNAHYKVPCRLKQSRGHVLMDGVALRHNLVTRLRVPAADPELQCPLLHLVERICAVGPIQSRTQQLDAT